MASEELTREIVSKICPFHGKRASVNMHEAGEIEISACCKEFHAFLETLSKNKFQKGSDNGSAFEIISGNDNKNKNQ
jgi:hypothetical protein